MFPNDPDELLDYIAHLVSSPGCVLAASHTGRSPISDAVQLFFNTAEYLNEISVRQLIYIVEQRRDYGVEKGNAPHVWKEMCASYFRPSQ